MSDDLTDLEQAGIGDCNSEAGAYSTESMYVRFSFTRQAFESSVSQLLAAGKISNEFRTCIHETVHHLHTVTTPLGFFVHALRSLQTSLVFDALSTLRHANVQLSQPIVLHVSGFTKNAEEAMQQILRVWYTAEFFILKLYGETARWRDQFLNNPYVSRGDSVAQFAFLTGALLVQASPESDWSHILSEIESEMRGAVADHRPEKLQFSSEIFGLPANLTSILESAASVAERWGDDSITLEEFWNGFKDRPSLGTSWAPYVFPIRYAYPAIRARNLRQFVYSYLALCDAALCCPILPQRLGVRRPRKITELIPFLRWTALVGAAERVKPMSSPDDYHRYTSELCNGAGFATPEEVISVDALPVTDARNPRWTLYTSAQKHRRSRPWQFLDFPQLMLGSMSTEWTFPIIEYSDRTFFHTNKDLLERFRISDFLRLVSRKLMLADDLQVKCPYRATTEHKTYLTAEISAIFERVWGARLPGFEII